MSLTYPKPQYKKQRKQKQADRKVWEKKNREECLKLNNFRCVTHTIFANSKNDMENMVDWAHLVGRSKAHPEWDTPEYTIPLRRFVHLMYDGEKPNPFGMEKIDFRIWLLEKIKSERKACGLPFRWQPALDLLKERRGDNK